MRETRRKSDHSQHGRAGDASDGVWYGEEPSHLVLLRGHMAWSCDRFHPERSNPQACEGGSTFRVEFQSRGTFSPVGACVLTNSVEIGVKAPCGRKTRSVFSLSKTT